MNLIAVNNPDLIAIPGVAKWGAVRKFGELREITIAKVYRIRDPQPGEELALGAERARVETVAVAKDSSLTTVTARMIS